MIEIRSVVAGLAAAILGGCASGGGGGGDDGFKVEKTEVARPSPTAEMRCLWFLPFICGWFEPGETESQHAGFRSGIGPQAERFTSWAGLAPQQAAQFDAITLEGTQTMTGPQYTAGKELVGGSVGRLAEGIDVSASRVGDATQTAVIANPYAQGWNYQSFGIWNTHGPSTRQIAAFSFGAPTPASSVPSSGTATFIGKLGAVYVSPSGEGSMASAELRVNADFGNRSLAFTSSGTRLTQDLRTSIAAPNLNLNGTLSYSPASNAFSGTLTTAGGLMSGTSSGRYYGPAAQELGGVFAVKSSASSEALTGAYGAKR